MQVTMGVIITVVIFFISGGVFVFLMSTPTDTGLIPRGGRRYKIILAWLILQFGSFKREDKLGFEYANKRVEPLPGTDIEQYNDSFVFHGSNRDGELFMTRIGFRNGGREAEVWLWMVLEGKKYVNIHELVETDPEEKEAVSAGGLTYRCIDDDSSQWHITYNGKVKPGQVECRVDLSFKAVSKMYHSGIHMDKISVAKAMSEMKWSRQYFENLRSENQTRIEQGGELTGTISLAEKKYDIKMLSIRDHSWGKRDWRFINRYIWNIFSFTTDFIVNGSSFRYLVFTTVDYGTTFRNLVSGWIAGEKEILPIVEASRMANLAGEGTIPEFFLQSFKPKGGDLLSLKVRRSEIEQPWMTQGEMFEVNEAYARGRVGTSRGSGMSEFGFAINRGYKRPGDKV